MAFEVRPTSPELQSLPGAWVVASQPSSPQLELNESQRRRKRSPNRIKAKPASPAVISSIISSLDSLPPLPLAQSSDQTSDSATRRSRRDSSDGTIASGGSARRSTLSTSFGVEYGADPILEQDDDSGDAAQPPTIPTSRASPSLPHHAHRRSSGLIHIWRTDSLRSRPNSVRSSHSAASLDRSGSIRNKLSSESWVRHNMASDEPLEAPRGRTSWQGRRRGGSREIPRSRSRTSELSSKPSLMSRAEQIITHPPPPLVSSPRGRLYLRDPTISEDHATSDTLKLTTSPTDSEPISEDLSPNTGFSISARVSPARSLSHISDSIPTRTSSLRQASSSPAPNKKKDKRSKRLSSSSRSDGKKTYRRSRTIQEDSWADLGDDDETVRRIKQLRELRKTRQQEVEPPRDASRPRSPHQEISTPVPSVGRDRKAASSRTYPIQRSITEPTASFRAFASSQEPQTPPSHSTRSPLAQAQDGFDSQGLPTSTFDSTFGQQFALDYSYADAVDMLQHAHDMETVAEEEPLLNDDHSIIILTGSTHKPSNNHIGSVSTMITSKSPKRRPNHQRQTSVQSAPAQDLDRKLSKIKTSARAVEEDHNVNSVDSVEEDVSDFLRDPRLSRTIQNPTSGRVIAFSEVGDPQGAAVFVCVGMGLTRYVTAFYDELATTLRLRLITVDRPGIGGSEAYPPSDKTGPLGWPDDVLAVCQNLGITKFSLLAHSAGVIYALATALILPHLVKGRLHLLAPWIPPSQLEVVSHPTASSSPAGALPRGQRLLRVLPAPFLKAANTSFMTAASASLKPGTRRRTSGSRTPSRMLVDHGDSPHPSPSDRPMSKNGRTEFARRESMMLMDRYMPSSQVRAEAPRTPNREGPAEKLSYSPEPLSPHTNDALEQAQMGYGAHAQDAAESARERQAQYTRLLTQRTWDLAIRDSNPATDLLVCLERQRDVGFRYTDVGREVVITHGSEDKRVPLGNVMWLAEQMNRRGRGQPDHGRDGLQSREDWDHYSTSRGCEVRILQGEGHGLMANPRVMGDALADIASYWVKQEKRTP